LQLLGDSQKVGMDSENMNAGKNILGEKPSVVTRSALGNISNKNTTTAHGVQARKYSKKHALTNKENAAITTRSRAKEITSSMAVKEKPKERSPRRETAMEVVEEPAVVMYDVDKEDQGNPQLVSEYVQDVYAYLRKLEREIEIKEDFLSLKRDNPIKPRMRKILIDWLVQVHSRFHLLQETLYITVSIIDRFLEEACISRNELQLVGVTAMLIASKYEEMYSPEVNDFVYISDKAYKKDEILKMEMIILKTLDFRLGKPIPLHFLRRYSKVAEVDALKHGLAKYLMELCLTEYSLCHVLPSKIAAAALFMSMKILGGENAEWTDALVHHSTYRQEDLVDVLRKMAVLVKTAESGKTTAVYRKYCGSKHLRVASMAELKSPIIQNLSSLAESVE